MEMEAPADRLLIWSTFIQLSLSKNKYVNKKEKLTLTFSAQPEVPASQVNAVFDQWRASSFGATAADKKDQMPSAPAVPANDEFAAFMKMQSASSNSMETTPVSQQTAVPAATQQRSEIPQPQQPNMFPMQPQPQTANIVPGQGQAYYVQPEEIGAFPANSWNSAFGQCFSFQQKFVIFEGDFTRD